MLAASNETLFLSLHVYSCRTPLQFELLQATVVAVLPLLVGLCDLTEPLAASGKPGLTFLRAPGSQRRASGSVLRAARERTERLAPEDDKAEPAPGRPKVLAKSCASRRCSMTSWCQVQSGENLSSRSKLREEINPNL